MIRAALVALAAILALGVPSAHCADLYRPGGWPAMATDRTPRSVGDVIEIVVSQSAAATDTATNGSTRSSNIGGQVQAGAAFNQGGAVSLQGGSNDTGTTGRSGAIIAVVSARVDEVLPNGDLRVSGAQALDINGERTDIKIKGVVRTADIAPDNSVPSSRLADAAIDYNGSGFVSSSSAPGLLTRIFNWLGIP